MKIDEIFKPITLSSFKKNYFKEKSLYIKGAYDKYLNIFNWDDLNILLDNSLLPDKDIRLIRNSSYKKINSIKEIRTAINDGYSLIFNKLHQKCKKIGFLSEQIGYFFNEPAQVNLYMSQSDTSGFNIHYDTHDVIVLQIYGCKHWDIYHPTVKKPVFTMKSHGIEKPKYSPYMSQTLKQGDALYVPRGHWHFPIAVGGEPSLHLTIGIKSKTGLDFIKWLQGELTDSPLWREEFTFNSSKHFQEIKKDLIKIINSKSCFDDYKEFCSMNLWHVEEANLPHSFINLDKHNIRSSKLRIRKTMPIIDKRNGGNIILLHNNKKITLSGKTDKLISYVLSGKVLNLASLDDYDFDLTKEQIYKVSETLFLEGFISFYQ